MILTFKWHQNKVKNIKPTLYEFLDTMQGLIMQSLKNLPKAMTAKKQLLKFLSSWKDVSFEYVQKWKPVDIHDLLNLLINTNFQLNWTRAQQSQLKLFNTAVTLK